jgi:hypothetical protein
MSIISGEGKMLHLLKSHNSAVKAKKIAKPEYRESKCSSILLLSLAISVAIILLMFVGYHTQVVPCTSFLPADRR